MSSIEIVIRDDKGNILNTNVKRIYELKTEGKSFYEIEGAVEEFKKKVLPDIEKHLLEKAQREFIEEKKTK
jgi:hypothetical protein